MKINSYWTWSPVFNGDTPFSTHSHSDFSPSSEVATTRQTDGAAHKLKPRSFHKSAHLRVHSADFHPGMNRAWHGWTIQSGIICRVKLKICSTMLLYSKEGWIVTTGTRLLETKPVYNKEQDTITLNWRSYWQTKKSKILQQTKSYLEV